MFARGWLFQISKKDTRRVFISSFHCSWSVQDKNEVIWIVPVIADHGDKFPASPPSFHCMFLVVTPSSLAKNRRCLEGFFASSHKGKTDIGALGCSWSDLVTSPINGLISINPRQSLTMGSLDSNKNPLTFLAQQLCLSPTLQINELVHKKQAEGHRVVHLGFGEATFPIAEHVLKAHREASEETSYQPVAGLMKLREVGGI